MPGSAAAIRQKLVLEAVVPTGFTFGPGNRIWYVEKFSGRVVIFDRDGGKTKRFYRFDDVSSDGERGALGIVLHPNYAQNGYVFVYVTRKLKGHGAANMIVRLHNHNGFGNNPTVIYRKKTTHRVNHNGGRILFGPDGTLYAIVGDGGVNPGTAQDLNDPRGKILRMTPAGDVPGDNPFPGELAYAYGIRNSFGFTFDPVTGDIWETENGPDCNDEINHVLAGENHAWGNSQTCAGADPGNTNQDGPAPVLPILWYTPTLALTGAAFCDGCELGAASEGTLFFSSYKNGQVHRATLNMSRDDVVADDVVFDRRRGLISMERAPDGALFVSDPRGIWRLR